MKISSKNHVTLSLGFFHEDLRDLIRRSFTEAALKPKPYKIMMFDACCPSCNTINKTPSHYEGMSIKCLKCHENFVAIHSKDRLFKFHCSSCGGRIEAKERLRGTQAPCPHCNKVVPVGDYTQATKPLQEPVESAGVAMSHIPPRAKGGSISSKLKRAITKMFGG